jgi:hypothetical protein
LNFNGLGSPSAAWPSKNRHFTHTREGIKTALALRDVARRRITVAHCAFSCEMKHPSDALPLKDALDTLNALSGYSRHQKLFFATDRSPRYFDSRPGRSPKNVLGKPRNRTEHRK